MRARACALLVVVVVGTATTGCRSRVASLRDALLEGGDAPVADVVDAPACKDAGCLDGMARALGAKKGFDANDPDQASAGAVAVVLARDHRGDLVPDADRWVAAVTMARGYGADALRLALARGMADVAPRLGRSLGNETEVAGVVRAMAAAMPGACDAYASLGAKPVAELSPASRPETSKCVQRDLERKDGPGAGWGKGTWRAAAGALALWKAYARALREGESAADAVARPVLDAKLAVIETATAKVALKPPAD
ncbi:MAG TPA: hypothetical protein VIY73_13055 [Polyangiaceae bacterium]